MAATIGHLAHMTCCGDRSTMGMVLGPHSILPLLIAFSMASMEKKYVIGENCPATKSLPASLCFGRVFTTLLLYAHSTRSLCYLRMWRGQPLQRAAAAAALAHRPVFAARPPRSFPAPLLASTPTHLARRRGWRHRVHQGGRV